MWEWIALAMGAAFISLYLYALRSDREKRQQTRRSEGQWPRALGVKLQNREVIPGPLPEQT